MDIRVKTIKHTEQRYPTIGDWWFNEDGALEIRVTNIGDLDYEALVTVHEIIEALLCRSRNISEAAVTKFDKDFEAARLPDDYSEPGNDPAAPYYHEHAFATSIEMRLAAQLKVSWSEYDEAVNKF